MCYYVIVLIQVKLNIQRDYNLAHRRANQILTIFYTYIAIIVRCSTFRLLTGQVSSGFFISHIHLLGSLGSQAQGGMLAQLYSMIHQLSFEPISSLNSQN